MLPVVAGKDECLLCAPQLRGYESAGQTSNVVTERFRELIPAIIDGEKEFSGARDIHAAKYKTGRWTCKQCSNDGCPVGALCSAYPHIQKIFQLVRSVIRSIK